MLLPIGRDDSEIQRHAYVSYCIIALNILVFVYTAILGSNRENVVEAQYQRTVSYLAEHPYLTVPPALDKLLSSRAKKQLALLSDRGPRPLTSTGNGEQEELERRVAALVAAMSDLPIYQFGYRVSDPSLLTLITSMFVHGGFGHLLGNLLFFFITGPFIEDVYGRPAFAALYFGGGIVATFTWAAHHKDATIPLIGASGAIAAVMGASLVRFLRSRLEFIWIPFLLKSYRFFVPVFVVLPLWFVEQLWLAGMETGAAGTAFWGHIGGFVFGVAFAWAVRLTNFEEKFVKPVVAKETTWAVDEAINQASLARQAGDFDTARSEIKAFLTRDPKSADGLRLAVDIGLDALDHSMIDVCATRLFERYIELQEKDMAVALAEELCGDVTTLRLPRFLARVAAYIERTDADWALLLYQRLCLIDPNSSGTVRNLMKMGMLLRTKGDLTSARRAYERARSHPSCSADSVVAIEAKLGQLAT